MHTHIDDWPLSGPPAPSIRRRLEDTIEALLAELDALDGDADLEEAGDEADQSFIEWSGRPRGFDIDRLDLAHEEAEEDDTAEDGADAEPWLGYPEGNVGQSPHNCGGDDDREEGDDPPEATWLEGVNQTRERHHTWCDDSEPWLAAPEAHVSIPYAGLEWWSRAPRRVRGARETRTLDGSQVGWGVGSTSDGEEDYGEMAEAVNEDGGDVQDELHDAVDEDTGIGDRDAMMAEDFPRAWDLAGINGWRSEHGQDDRRLANTFAMRALAIKERREPFTDPTRLPRHYSINAIGNCMEPKVKGGRPMVFDTEHPVQPGDTVAVWFKPGKVPPGFTRITMKQFVARDAMSITVETLNPPRIYRFALAAVWAVHRHSHFM